MSEKARLAALQAYRILDTAAEPEFDRLTALASDLFDAPIALVSLIDAERQWFKSRVGLEERSTSRDKAFCAHALALERHQVMVVEDALADPRFAENPLVVGAPRIRFYAGALLTDDEGFNLGTLCVIDTKPRPRPSERELERLKALAALVVDLLKRARAERLLAEQQNLLAMAEGMSSVGHWRFDRQSGAVQWSDEVYRIFGRDPASFQPTLKEMADVYGPEQYAALQERLTGAIKNRFGYEAEMHIRRPDGGRREIHLRATCEVDEANEVVAIFGVIMDVTDRIAALNGVRKSQARYKLLADNMADVITRIRLDGSSNYISPAIERLIGYTPREMAGRPAQAFVYEPDLPLVTGAFAELAGGADEISLQHRAQHRDGHPVWVETRFRLIRDEAGAPKEMVAVIRDISDRKRLEDHLAAMASQLRVAKDAAEAANEAKSQFLANMSHELRTPLNGVIGFSRLLVESADLTPEDRRRVLMVREAGEALSTLINDVLDYSKLEARAAQLDASPFSVGDLVSEALAMVEPQATEKGLQLRIAGDDAGVLVGDKHRLRQVLLNFLSNAVKFTAAGAVTVMLDRRDRGSGVDLKVSVVDEGVGIAPDKLDALFKRFSQADGSVTRTYGGTGLGLAISRELIELMGGRIGVDSTPGQGSTFWFEVTLPRSATGIRSRKTKSRRPLFPGLRVLVVDDVALNRELLQELLKRHGCESDIAVDGRQAVEAVARARYDLVLMDVHMPVMDGLAATRAIRAGGEVALPIVALSASGSPEQVQACLEAGMNGHLLKPLDRQELEQTLSSAFARRPAPPAPGGGDGEMAAQDAFTSSMGAAATLRFVTLFRTQLGERFRNNELASLIEDAHKVAGAAGMLGFTALGHAASALEAACREGRDYAEPLAELRVELATARRSLSAWAKRLSQDA